MIEQTMAQRLRDVRDQLPLRETYLRDLLSVCAQAFENQMHCATCQCARIHGEKPVPNNPRSKSWHDVYGNPETPIT